MPGRLAARRSGRATPDHESPTTGAPAPRSRVVTLRFGRSWARLGPWRGDAALAHLVVSPEAALDCDAVGDCVQRARADGYRGLVTSALSEREVPTFVAHDFAVQEHLHLLSRDLDEEPSVPALPLTKV